jgi:hypothetical protein
VGLDAMRGPSRHAQENALSFGHFVEDVRSELAEDFAAGSSRFHDACGLEARNVP